MVDSDSRVRSGGPVATAGPPVVPQELSRISLIAVTLAVLAEVLRAGFPAFGHYTESGGAVTATLVILVSCLSGFLAPGVRAVAGPRGLPAVAIGGLLAVRLAMQAVSPALWLAFAGAVFGMLAVTALYEAARGLSGTGFAVAATAGLTGDTALRLAFGTWDPPARAGVAAWIVTLLIVAGGVAALVRWLRNPPVEAPVIGWRDALGAAALGPFLALQILVLSSPAFTSSSGGLPLAVAGVVVLAGQALAMAFLSSGLAVAAVPGGVCVFGGTLLGVGAGAVTGRYGLTGAVAIAVVIIGQVLSAWLLAVASRVPLRRGGYRGRPAERGGPPPDVSVPDTGGRAWRIDLGAALGALGVLVVILPYQLHYTHPLPLPNKVLPGLAGIALGLLSAIAAARGGPLPARSAVRALGAGAGALVLAVVPVIYAVTAPSVTRAATRLPGTFRLVSYDIHDAIGDGGRLDPEAIARAIEAQRADVVALQGVGRGRPMSGTTDVASWLARRLKMRLVWGAAADHQDGNAVLTRLRVKATGAGRLPVGAGPQAPGYVWARVDVGGGNTADVWSVRLQQGADRAQSRLTEIGKLLQVWSGAPRTIIAGNMGAGPGTPELSRLMGQSGLRGTMESPPPTMTGGVRADWILGSDDLGFDNSAVDSSRRASDHYPVAATVRVVG
ncbi:endonuclease/exonuclease/phosphatase [Actinoallomurus spadix]|uniref:Endonuclease/exonuclease/phosphatase n=1 Tax=Actinoallomurus spadix TaxID=79912 RepID=A0ABN0W208_9ACTN|nr:endonuclease/exonuclease/phosphatase [Actinoallomurus spadix]MCO5985428.1 endonuclease/exonuclease/phosphatase [Actinoallomurus spadix]